MDHSSCFNPMFKRASVLACCLGSAKCVSNKIFAFHKLKFEVLSHDSAEHSLESHRTICNRFLQYSSQRLVVIVNCHFSTISVGVESSEAINNTKHLFLNSTIAFSVSVTALEAYCIC